MPASFSPWNVSNVLFHRPDTTVIANGTATSRLPKNSATVVRSASGTSTSGDVCSDFAIEASSSVVVMSAAAVNASGSIALAHWNAAAARSPPYFSSTAKRYRTSSTSPTTANTSAYHSSG